MPQHQLYRDRRGGPAVDRDVVTRVPTRAPVTLQAALSRGRVRGMLALFGPAFVASVAYVDPGNFATNFAGGAEHGYQLVWVVVMANVMAMLVQYLSSKAGLASGRSLPELCRDRFCRPVNAILWLQAEVVAMATDLAEFVGAAIGLNLVFGMPLFLAGLVTATVAFAILALSQRGHRQFELAVIALLGFVAAGFVYVFFAVGNQNYRQLAAGIVPSLSGVNTLGLAVGIVGATVMPHVVYLHSALQKGRVQAADDRERHTLLAYNKWDCIMGLGVAGLVNLSMLCIAAALFHKPGLTSITDLGSIHDHLDSLVGGGAALGFGIALMASGFSSSSVATYAGQVVMAGFMDWRIPILLRRVLTMLPSLVILALAVNTTQALIYSQIVLSFGIPFALVPLLLVTRDGRVMRDMTNRRITTTLMLLIVVIITSLNIYLLYDALRALLLPGGRWPRMSRRSWVMSSLVRRPLIFCCVSGGGWPATTQTGTGCCRSETWGVAASGAATVAEGLAGCVDLGGSGAGLAGAVEAGAAVVGEVRGYEAGAVPALDAGGCARSSRAASSRVSRPVSRSRCQRLGMRRARQWARTHLASHVLPSPGTSSC
jgi:manganese transport protein